MRSLLCLLGVLLLLAALPAEAAAQEAGAVRVSARVTSSSPGLVGLDRGSGAGLEPGDRVRLFPLGSPTLEGRVQSVSDRTATVQLDDAQARVDIGSRAEVLVPADRFAEPEAGPGGDAPTHPPWTRQPDEWEQGMPLLAKSKGREPAARPTEIHGRFFTSVDRVSDDERDRSSLYGRAGTDLRADNPFGRGGRFHLDVEFLHRVDAQPGGPDETASRVRLDRLSWAVGGDRHTPTRWEAGRFLHDAFPEFGVMDGVDGSFAVSGTDRLGASLGYLPELSGDFTTGEDLASTFYWSHASGEDRRFRAGAGFQKSWHEGEADRDLLLAKLSLTPRSGFQLYSTAWLDLYGSEDTAKSSGAELTQLFTSAGWRAENGDGFRVGFSRLRFPQTLRLQLNQLTLGELADNQTDRVDVSGWKRVSDGLRLTASLDSWSDEDDSGGGGRLRADWRELLAGGDLGATLFFNQGQFSDVSGLRLDADWATGLGWWRVSWETALLTQVGFVGGQEELLQHAAELSWDLAGASDWSLSSYLELRFGDELGSTTLGFFLQNRF